MKRAVAVLAVAFSTAPLFATADLSTSASTFAPVIRAGFTYSGVFFEVKNLGPDAAPDVHLTFTSSAQLRGTDCFLSTMKTGQSQSCLVEVTAPATAGPLTITGTASSGTPDPNPADNTTTLTMTVSTDPDLSVRVLGPFTQDLAQAMPLDVYVSNQSKSDAHEVDVTLDFSPAVAVQTLPAACRSVAAGRVICHADLVAPTTGAIPPLFHLVLIAPQGYGSGSVGVTATITAREHDFDPESNVSMTTISLFDTIYVTTTANDGAGSLRQAILDANAHCTGATPCAIAFDIDEGPTPPFPWKTIRVTSPLPPLFAPRVRIDGNTQAGFFSDRNGEGPEIEITGGGSVNGDGLVVTSCGVEVANLTINSFLGNGVSVIDALHPATCSVSGTMLRGLYVGTDPRGLSARANLRGIGTSVTNGATFNDFGLPTTIRDCLISGNERSGIFDLSGRINVAHNRIGLQARENLPLPNGESGVFIGEGGYGSDVGPNVFDADSGPAGGGSNVIAFNGDMGVAVAAGVNDVAIRANSIWGNGGLGIDVGLDGPTLSGKLVIPAPVLTSAHYDAFTRKTIVEGDMVLPPLSTFEPYVEFFANDAPDPNGFGEGQQPLGQIRLAGTFPIHFQFAVDGDFTGRFISSTATRVHYVGFAKPDPEGIDQGFLTQTSEFSRLVEVR